MTRGFRKGISRSREWYRERAEAAPLPRTLEQCEMCGAVVGRPHHDPASDASPEARRRVVLTWAEVEKKWLCQMCGEGMRLLRADPEWRAK